jgi:hypothetical protein
MIVRGRLYLASPVVGDNEVVVYGRVSRLVAGLVLAVLDVGEIRLLVREWNRNGGSVVGQ